MLTDPIADMLTRIRNANKALHESAPMPSSRMKVEIARLLKEEGYITDYRIQKGADQKAKDGTPAPRSSRCATTPAATAAGVRAPCSKSSGSAGSACGNSPTRA